MISQVLRESILFSGFTETEMAYILQLLRCREVRYYKGEILFDIDSSIEAFGIVLAGNVQVATYDINGNRMIMANVRQGGIFAESLAFTGKKSPVYAVAARESVIAWLDAEVIKNAHMSENPALRRLGKNFSGELASRALSMNNRIQILSKKSIREKVIAFLTFEYNFHKKKSFTIPFSRRDLADYLGVERSALSRELSKMEADGLIKFHKNQFEILL